MPKELCVLATGQEISEGNCGVFSFQKEKKTNNFPNFCPRALMT